MNRRSFLAVVMIGIVAVHSTGCAEKGAGARARVPVYKVKGRVTFNGNPIAGAAVSFSPTGSQPAAVGRTNDDGEFSLTTYRAGDGAAEGDFKVMISLIEETQAAAPEEAHGTTPGQTYNSGTVHGATKRKSGGSILPLKYSDVTQTPLTATVRSGEANEAIFDLK